MVLNSILKSQVLSSISSWFPRSSHLPFRDQLHHPHPFSLLHLWPPYLCVPGPKCRSSHRRKTFHIRIFTLSWFSRRSSHLPVWDQILFPSVSSTSYLCISVFLVLIVVLNTGEKLIVALSWFYRRSSHLPVRDQLHHPHSFRHLHQWSPYPFVPGPQFGSKRGRNSFLIRIVTLSQFYRRTSHLPVRDELRHPRPFRHLHQWSPHLCVPGPGCGPNPRRGPHHLRLLRGSRHDLRAGSGDLFQPYMYDAGWCVWTTHPTTNHYNDYPRYVHNHIFVVLRSCQKTFLDFPPIVIMISLEPFEAIGACMSMYHHSEINKYQESVEYQYTSL